MQMLKNKTLAQVVITLILLLVYGALVTQKTNLHTADLGRHIKNGEIAITQRMIPQTNYYSHTYPDFPFLNHHWGTGVVFFLIWKVAGFAGLSVFFSLISIATLFIFFYLAKKYANFELAVLATVVMLPVITSRVEIRPEAISYLFVALFFWILWEHAASHRALIFLPILELIWVNMHVYFFLGIGLIGVFLFSAVCNKNLKLAKTLAIILVATSAVTLLNPAGLKGALYPLNIFTNYGYRVLENQSVVFLSKLILHVPSLYFIFAFEFLCLSWLVVFALDRRNFFKNYLELFILSVLFSVIAWQAVRNFALFGYFALFVSAINFKNIKGKVFYPYIFTLCAFILFVLTLFSASYWTEKFSAVGVGLGQNVSQAADFYIANNLKGPIFNNYDNGGYLIFYLFPKEKVFVDNRPEAYPTDFFNSTYIPMQENEQKWAEVSAQNNLNVIFFYRKDYTPWAQAFLIKRISDPAWAPVYVDEYSIIFVMRTEQNADVIKKFELPKSVFVTASQ